MSTTVNYKGSTITTVNNQTKTLTTAGTWLEGDIQLVDVTEGGAAVLSDETNVTGTTAVITGDVPEYGTKTITVNGTYSAEDDGLDGYSEVTVNVSGGSAEVPETVLKDVTLIDYDGTVLHEYTKTEFLALTALPENPSHTGLVAQGWNWSLANAKTYVSKWDCLVIGQNYTTSDGKTRIYINVTDAFISIGNYFRLGFTCSVNGGAVIDWGDGSTTTSSGTGMVNYTHTYTTAGEYLVTITVAEGATINLGFNGSNQGFFYFGNDNHPAKLLPTKIEIGNRVTRFNRNCFNGSINLKSISIPNTITEIGNSTGNGSTFATTGITGLVIPNSVATIPTSLVSECNDLVFISVPSSITAIGNSPFSAGALQSLRALTLPDTITTFATAFSGISYRCPKVEKFSCPCVREGILESGYFRENYYCRKIIIPASVTQINDYAMTSSCGLKEMYLLPETPPTIVNTRGMPYMSLTIYVPYSADHSILEAYQTATNWSSYADRMVEMT